MKTAISNSTMDCSRRQFLSVAAGGLAAGCNAWAFGEEAGDLMKVRWRMRLSTSSIHFTKLPIEQACERIKRLGFDAVDIWSAHAGCPHLDDVQARLGADGLKDLLERLKLKLFAFSVYQGGYPKYAELLGKAGGGVAVRGSTKPCPPKELTSHMRRFLEDLKPQIELAEKWDSHLAIENHGHALLDSIDSFKAFTDMNKSQRLGIALAPYHVQALGGSVEQAIAVSGRQLFFFYAWQHAKGREQLPGNGQADFTPWLTALAKVQYRGFVNPFMHGDVAADDMSAQLAKSRGYLNACDAKAGES